MAWKWCRDARHRSQFVKSHTTATDHDPRDSTRLWKLPHSNSQCPFSSLFNYRLISSYRIVSTKQYHNHYSNFISSPISPLSQGASGHVSEQFTAKMMSKRTSITVTAAHGLQTDVTTAVRLAECRPRLEEWTTGGVGAARRNAAPPPMIAGENNPKTLRKGVIRRGGGWCHARKRRRAVRWPTEAPPGRSLVAHAQLKAAQLPLLLPFPFSSLSASSSNFDTLIHPPTSLDSCLVSTSSASASSSRRTLSTTTSSFVDSSVFQPSEDSQAARPPTTATTTAIRPSPWTALYLQADSPKPAHFSLLDSNSQDCFVCLLFC